MASVQQQAEAAIALCREQGFGSFLAQATMYRGYALAQQGQTEEGIATDPRGFGRPVSTGASLFRPWFLGFLAEAYGTAGRFEEGLAAVAEAIAIVEKTGQRYNEAALHRLKGNSSSGVPASKRSLPSRRKRKNASVNPSRLRVNRKPSRSS